MFTVAVVTIMASVSPVTNSKIKDLAVSEQGAVKYAHRILDLQYSASTWGVVAGFH